jgi:Icc-related predicted phosphoesterase
LLKDWERYDVSRYVDPGCVSPEEGWRTVPLLPDTIRHTTIQSDLERLTHDADLANSIFLFHSPPHQTTLDRAALDSKMIDSAPLDVHVGSIAIRRFIQAQKPWITLHGHIHESPRLTGTWREKIGRTHLFSAAHDGEELALVRFDPAKPERATRELV